MQERVKRSCFRLPCVVQLARALRRRSDAEDLVRCDEAVELLDKRDEDAVRRERLTKNKKRC